MTDDAHDPSAPDPHESALSALVDGVATADERALVEGSPELTAELAGLHAQRAALRDVPVPAAAREAAIAAALAVFDELHAPAAASADVAGARVFALQRRRRQYRVLMGAAAAIVAVVGVGALAIGGSGSDDSSTAIVADEAARAPESAKTAGADELSAPAATDAPAAEAAAEAATEAAPDDAGDQAPAATFTPLATIGSIDAAGGAALDSIESADELLAWSQGRAVVLAADGTTLACVPADTEAIGQVLFEGRQVVIARDPATGTIAAYDLVDCTLVVTVAP